MYQFFVILQYVCIIVLFVELIYITRQSPSRQQMLLQLFAVVSLVNAMGYLFEIQSVTREAAFAGTKLSYLGKPFIALTMFLFVLDVCKINIPRKVTTGMIVFHAIIAALVITSDYHTLYYTSIGYTQSGLFPHLILGHGIFYNLYMAVLFIYMILTLILCIRRFCITKDRIEKRQVVYLALMTLSANSGLVVFLSGITQGYDTTALGLAISVSLMFLGIFRHNLLDTLEMAKDYVIDNFADGLVVLNTSDELIYANVLAKKIYPALAGKKHSKAVEEIKNHGQAHDNIFWQEKVYAVSSREIMQEDILRGRMYLLNDVTENYDYTLHLQKAVQEKTSEISHIQHSIIASFANMVEARDGITGQHIKRTSSYVEIITQALLEDPEFKEVITAADAELIIDAAPLHDIGKISIPDSILSKPGRLSAEEFDVIKSHPETGAHIIDDTLAEVEGNSYLSVARDMAYYHHEKWDGSGYPCGLKGEEIPLSARIMAIADVYEALRSKRPYKEPFSAEKSRAIIEESSGTHFDPKIVDVFLRHIQQIEMV